LDTIEVKEGEREMGGEGKRGVGGKGPGGSLLQGLRGG